MHRESNSWVSPRLGREMEFLWFGHAGRPLLIFPTSAARYYQNEDQGIIGALGEKIDRGELQVVCVDSVDDESWYNKSAHPADRVRRHAQYDAYLREEMIPYVQHRAGRADLVVYGASFGAYHAANFAARYPEVVSRAILFSGIYDIHRFLDGYWDDLAYFHCPTSFIPNMDGEWVRRLSNIGWVIATGEHDSLIQPNRDFDALLSWKGIPHYAEFWPGVFGHDWPWWRENLRRFVP
ncbi:MAG TPA: alpha/beta hydrolase-fold protein [Thermoanaerobaculia bacterium]